MEIGLSRSIRSETLLQVWHIVSTLRQPPRCLSVPQRDEGVHRRRPAADRYLLDLLLDSLQRGEGLCVSSTSGNQMNLTDLNHKIQNETHHLKESRKEGFGVKEGQRWKVRISDQLDQIF